MRLLLDTNAYSRLGRGEPSLAGLVREAQSIVYDSHFGQVDGLAWTDPGDSAAPVELDWPK